MTGRSTEKVENVDRLAGKRLLLLAIVLLLPSMTSAAEYPSVHLSLGTSDDPADFTTSLTIVMMLTVLALAPSILVMMTSFTRILVVFAFLRQALGTQQTPPNQVLIGLALFMTAFIMMPVWKDIDAKALTPYLNEEISQSEAFERAKAPLRAFMLRQTRDEDLQLFLSARGESQIADEKQAPMLAVIPAFIISELRTAFEIGFLIYIPFVIIDLVVASVLMSMGMMMLPPVMISLPLKIILFVLIDGWHLLAQNLLTSFK